ncbi:type II toxin-antitoxin system HicB family antitoxin [Fodinisporobacter ferrooxydans]|uniref:Type II toxin-antitoxin system HicB family antitoxin n=1 Tax=Fodinisporobacter ferrooxydans TaxID=2901836 RepID=A0ABY4CP17_9BACL|nr:type II toxin-antitoxin system HicB family antitoxin [Alicyclobacillaceae bacterium MYW30-H2]
MTEKNLDYYLSLPYTITLIPAQEGGYVVKINELPGCLSQGETVEEALSMIEDAKRAWIEVALEVGNDIPEPVRGEEEYSGKFNVRVPKSLHRLLAEKAKEEKVSLNQYVNYQLSRSVGHLTNRNKGV